MSFSLIASAGVCVFARACVLFCFLSLCARTQRTQQGSFFLNETVRKKTARTHEESKQQTFASGKGRRVKATEGGFRLGRSAAAARWDVMRTLAFTVVRARSFRFVCTADCAGLFSHWLNRPVCCWFVYNRVVPSRCFCFHATRSLAFRTLVRSRSPAFPIAFERKPSLTHWGAGANTRTRIRTRFRFLFSCQSQQHEPFSNNSTNRLGFFSLNVFCTEKSAFKIFSKPRLKECLFPSDLAVIAL